MKEDVTAAAVDETWVRKQREKTKYVGALVINNLKLKLDYFF